MIKNTGTEIIEDAMTYRVIILELVFHKLADTNIRAKNVRRSKICNVKNLVTWRFSRKKALINFCNEKTAAAENQILPVYTLIIINRMNKKTEEYNNRLKDDLLSKNICVFPNDKPNKVDVSNANVI